MRLASRPRLADPELAEEDPELAKVELAELEPEVEPENDEMEVEPLPNNRRTPLNTINAQDPIIIEPTRLFVDYAPVSAGPLRRGQTVCGSSSSSNNISNNIEGSSSKDVVEERPLEEIFKERPLSVRTLHRLASATLERAGKKFEYVRKEEVHDNSALAGSSSGESMRAQPAPVSPHEDSPRRRPAPHGGMVMQWQGGMPRMVIPIRSRFPTEAEGTEAEGPSAHRPAHIPDERT